VASGRGDLAPLDLSDKDAELVAQLAGPSPGNLPEVASLLRSLANSAPWRAAALASNLGKLPPPSDPAVVAGQERLAAMSAAFEREPRKCALARATLTRFVTAMKGRQALPAPFDRDLVQHGCNPLEPAGRASGLDVGLRFVTIMAEPGQLAAIYLLGTTPGLIEPASFHVGGALLLVAAVPRYAHVLVTIAASPSAEARGVTVIPMVEFRFADDDFALTVPRPACLDLSRVGMSTGGRLFVNGRPTPSGAPEVVLLNPAGGFNVQVFGPDGRRTLQRDVAAERLVGSNACVSIDADATQSSRKAVLLMVTSSGSGCANLAIDPLKIRAQVKDMIDRSTTGERYETRGIEVIDALRTITDFQTLMRSFGGNGAATGPPTDQGGNTDVARALQDVGFSIALSIDVRCVPIPNAAVQYTVVGQRVDIDRLIDASERSDRQSRMDSMSGYLSSQIESQAGEQSLRGLLQATVGNLFGLPYLRFAKAPDGAGENPDITFELEAGLPDRSGGALSARMTATLVSETGAQTCANYADLNTVRSTEASAPQEPLGRVSWTRVVSARFRRVADAVSDQAQGGPTPLTSGAASRLHLASFEIPFFPVEPGQYVVDVVIDGAKPELRVNRCLIVKEPHHLALVEIDDLSAITRGRAWQNKTTTQAYVLGGLVHRTSEAYSFGALVGLGYARYSAQGPPSWTDIGHATRAGSGPPAPGSVAYGADGKVDLSWGKISIAAGLSFERRLFRLATLFPGLQETMFRASAVYFDAMPLLDLGWYTAGSWPSGLSEQGGGQRLFDADGSLLFGLVVKANISDGQTVLFGVRGAWLGFDDSGTQEARRQTRMTYDNSFALGLQLGFGWHP